MAAATTVEAHAQATPITYHPVLPLSSPSWLVLLQTNNKTNTIQDGEQAPVRPTVQILVPAHGGEDRGMEIWEAGEADTEQAADEGAGSELRGQHCPKGASSKSAEARRQRHGWRTSTTGLVLQSIRAFRLRYSCQYRRCWVSTGSRQISRTIEMLQHGSLITSHIDIA